MSGQTKRAIGFLGSAAAVALLALWAPPAEAGHSGHRIRHGGSQQRVKRQGGLSKGKRAPRPGTRSAAQAR